MFVNKHETIVEGHEHFQCAFTYKFNQIHFHIYTYIHIYSYIHIFIYIYISN